MQLSQFTDSVRVTCFLTDNISYIHNQQCIEDRDGMHPFPISSHFLFIFSFLIFHQSYTQKRPSSKKTDKDNGDKTKSTDSGDGGDVKNNGASGAKYVSRARGTSDAKWRLGKMPGNDVSNSAYN